MELRRVVVTGLGLVTPLGCGVEATWANILAGKSGAKRIDDFQVDDIACQIAHRLPLGDYADGKYNPDEWMDTKEQRKVDPFIVYAMAAATQAIDDAGVEPKTQEEQERTGVLIGSGIGGVGGIYDASITLHEKGPRRISPFFIPGRLINLASGYVSIRFGLKGPNHSVVTACSTGAHAIGDAARLIALGRCRRDGRRWRRKLRQSPGSGRLCRLPARFRPISTTIPTAASRPYDKDRDGFVMGEGAGIVVLEDYERAKARGAKIYGEVIGYGLSRRCLPHHRTLAGWRRRLPRHERGHQARRHRAVRNRLYQRPRHLDAAGRRDRAGRRHPRARRRCRPRRSMSSTKSAIGHLLGAAGSVEAIFCLLAMRDNIAPPTLNLDNPSVETAINLVPKVAFKKEINVALSNSFGFGGTNATLVMRKVG